MNTGKPKKCVCRIMIYTDGSRASMNNYYGKEIENL